MEVLYHLTIYGVPWPRHGAEPHALAAPTTIHQITPCFTLIYQYFFFESFNIFNQQKLICEYIPATK